MRRLWRMMLRSWRLPWLGRYRCMCGRWSSNNVRAARRHALGEDHWVWDYETKAWVVHGRI